MYNVSEDEFHEMVDNAIETIPGVFKEKLDNHIKRISKKQNGVFVYNDVE